MKPFDPTKPVQFSDGQKARILCTDFKATDGRSILAARLNPSGEEMTIQVHPNGKHCESSCGLDLVNIHESFRREVWVNVYPMTEQSRCGAEGIGETFKTKDMADQRALENRLACVRIVIEGNEGDGL